MRLGEIPWPGTHKSEAAKLNSDQDLSDLKAHSCFSTPPRFSEKRPWNIFGIVSDCCYLVSYLCMSIQNTRSLIQKEWVFFWLWFSRVHKFVSVKCDLKLCIWFKILYQHQAPGFDNELLLYTDCRRNWVTCTREFSVLFCNFSWTLIEFKIKVF